MSLHFILMIFYSDDNYKSISEYDVYRVFHALSIHPECRPAISE